MKTRFANLFFAMLIFLPGISFAQLIAVKDSICVMQGQPIVYNVTANDKFDSIMPPPSSLINVFWVQPISPCINLSSKGELSFSPEFMCCGQTLKYTYRYESCDTCTAEVTIVIKCPKPDCFFVNMEDFIVPDSNENPRCALACEKAVSSYFATDNPGSTYSWSVTGGSYVPGLNAATIDVTWGAKGPGAVSVSITNGGVTTTIKACVDILEGPVASFVPSTTNVCLNSAAINFMNTSTGASTSFWDFGDGTTSTMVNAMHSFTTPGTHTICLYVTKNNFDTEGNPLCCCSDTACVDIVVDSLEGPNIFCVSTLCAYDSTKYWTDAQHCGTYTWTVLNEIGLAIPFSGQGNDTICVQWGAGPVGTVSLVVTNCASAYCNQPVTVTIPIIPATVLIGGDTVVCELASATYTVPKWIGVYYDWEVTGAISWTDEGTHSITVHWGSAGTGTITLKYYSDFLGGLPGQDPADCMGTATLTVHIKPRFEVTPPLKSVVCANDVSIYSAFPATTYHWTISGGPVPNFSGDGTDNILVTWDSGPGNYVITATPIDTTLYCNKVVTKFMQVVEVPLPTGIVGPLEICPGETYTYFGQTNQAGVGFTWTVTNGILNSTTGNPVAVTWGAAEPYMLSLQQFMLAPPKCSSQVITQAVQPKLISPFTIAGPSSVCINSLQNYMAVSVPPQHADATYHWEFTLATATLGSVVGGQGTDQIHVQWNNTSGLADLVLKIVLCGDTLSSIIQVMINAPTPPVITQNNTLCPGVPFILDAGPGSFYEWSISPTQFTQTITTSNVGTYSVTVTDANGCKANGSYTAVALQGPPSTPPVFIELCINPPCVPSTVPINGPVGTYSYAWTCLNVTSGTSIPIPSGTTNVLTHINTCVKATFLYTVTITDINGCTATAETTVIQTDVCPDPQCTPDPAASISFTAVNRMPDCNTVDFTALPVNASLVGWQFGDPYGGLNTGSLALATHTYPQVGDYTVVLSGKALNIGTQPPDSCIIAFSGIVHIPLVADFSYAVSCSTITFTNLTTYNTLPDQPTSWLWSFGDPANTTSGLEHPLPFSYPAPGPYTVTLIVTNAQGCQSTVVKTIMAGGAPVPGISMVTNPACVGDPVAFFGTGAGVTGWLWDFKDGSTNGSQNPLHSYLTPGPRNVMLTVTDAEGCTNMNSLILIINALPATAAITVGPPGLTICVGMSVNLTAPSGLGYTYFWSDSPATTTQTLTATQAGMYSVTVTNADSCTMMPDPVTVVVIPLPPAAVSGNPYICGGVCTMLSTAIGQNYTYLWSPNGEVTSGISACGAGLYSVTVTDPAYGCSAVSAPFDVFNAVPPAFGITVTPKACEGMPVTLSVSTVQSNPNIIYAWNNGATGPSITVTQAGNYIAVGRDTVTGCTGTASAVIHPLPDLCLVPVGCYEACNPDTICGPTGLTTYQWNKDGAPIMGETDSCLVVTQSGNYSLTGTNEFGCSLTSDTLMLQVIDCTCYGLSASATPAGTDSCCWKLSYNNPLSTLYSLVIHSSDADLSFSGLNASFSDIPGINTIALSNSVSNTMPLPSGVQSNFLTVCLSNVLNTPQQIIFDWYDANANILCSDTVDLFSQHLLLDTIFLCPGKSIMLGGANYTAPDVVMVTLPGTGGECDTLATYYLLLAPVHTVTLTCPPDITVNAASGQTSAVVNYASPTATSTCPGSIPTLTPIAGLPSGSAFPLGETAVCYIAKDGDNCCSNVDTCCFKVTVTNEEPCDEQTIDCIKFEELSITKDAAGNNTYRIRVINNCADPLIYAAFQVPDGITADTPVDNSVYTAPSGHQYDVRSPNFSPFYSIRFKSKTTGISNGQSDIFEYTLPPQICHACILAFVRLSTRVSYQAHLCCVMTNSLVVSPVVQDLLEPATNVVKEFKTVEHGLPVQFTVFPNPTDGTLFADLSDWRGEQLQVQVLNSLGQQLQNLTMTADGMPQLIELPKGLAEGLYFFDILTEKGQRQTLRFVLQH